MSVGQTALTYGLAPGLHVFVCVFLVSTKSSIWASHSCHSSARVLMTQTALALSLTPYLSMFTFLTHFCEVSTPRCYVSLITAMFWC